MNLFGDERIDRLAREFVEARSLWSRWQDVPRYTLRQCQRVTKERVQTAAVVAAVRVEDALKAAGEGHYWDDGTSRLVVGHNGRVRWEYSHAEAEANPC